MTCLKRMAVAVVLVAGVWILMSHGETFYAGLMMILCGGVAVGEGIR